MIHVMFKELHLQIVYENVCRYIYMHTDAITHTERDTHKIVCMYMFYILKSSRKIRMVSEFS